MNSEIFRGHVHHRESLEVAGMEEKSGSPWGHRFRSGRLRRERRCDCPRAHGLRTRGYREEKKSDNVDIAEGFQKAWKTDVDRFEVYGSHRKGFEKLMSSAYYLKN